MVPPAPLLSCAGDQASRGVLPLAPPAASREAGNHVKFSHSLLTVLYPVASEWRPRLPHRSVPKPRVTHTLLPVGPSPPSSTRGVCALAPRLLRPGVATFTRSLGSWGLAPSPFWPVCLCVWSPYSPPHTLPLETGLRHTSQRGIPLLKSLRKLSVALSKTD